MLLRSVLSGSDALQCVGKIGSGGSTDPGALKRRLISIKITQMQENCLKKPTDKRKATKMHVNSSGVHNKEHKQTDRIQATAIVVE